MLLMDEFWTNASKQTWWLSATIEHHSRKKQL